MGLMSLLPFINRVKALKCFLYIVLCKDLCLFTCYTTAFGKVSLHPNSHFTHNIPIKMLTKHKLWNVYIQYNLENLYT